jgi:biotin carboxylase
MSKTVMIFGAGINQLELIREANKLGVQTIVIDPMENPPGKSEASLFYKVAGDDYNKTLEIAKKYNIDGIVTGQMENPLPLMAKLANELGFVFNTPKVIERSLSKDLMKEAFKSNNIACASGVVFQKNEELLRNKLESLKFPLIMKPVDAFSSRGVVKVNSFEELKKYENTSREYSRNSKIIVEEFLEGKEFSVESITFQGLTKIIQVTEKFITPYPYTVEMGHLQPARLSKAKRTLVEQLVKKAITAIGIDNSASHAEVMVTKDGPKMVEIGARLGGDFISSYLTKASTGVSMDKAAVQIALGMEPDVTISDTSYSMIKYISLKEGSVVKKLPKIKDIMQLDGCIFCHYYIKEGEFVQPITDSGKRPVCIIVKSKDYNILLNKIEKYEMFVNQNIEVQ